MQRFTIEVGRHNDARREITDFVLPKDLVLPFPIRQVKIVSMHAEAAQYGLVVGNHYHPAGTGRYEFFIATGPDGDLFEARYRIRPEKNSEFTMRRGDACLIPPELSHAFKPLQAGATLIGLSNLAYDSAHDVSDVLF